MQNRVLTVALALSAILIFSSHLLPGQTQVNVRVLKTFDYPGANVTATMVRGINDRGDVVGSFEDSVGVTRGFVRFADGTFSAPIVEPNDVGNVTIATDINNQGSICGYFYSSAFYPYLGFVLSDTTFTEVGAELGANYFLNSMNDYGDSCATYDVHYLAEAILNVPRHGRMLFTGIGEYSEANSLNASATMIGDYYDSRGDGGDTHGFFRGPGFPEGRFLFPLDYPGAKRTFLLGIDDGSEWIVGRYVNTAGAPHGLILQRSDLTFTGYDFPEALETSINAISNTGLVAGYYSERPGMYHGFIGKLSVSR